MTVEPVDEKAVFNTARKIVDAGARESYLRLACADDQNAMRQIRDLLRVHEEEQSFLESAPPGLDATKDLPSFTQEPDEMIGTYKLREQIGEGGFGVVYVAEQQEPVVRKVALKIIKPGMDSKDVIARFEAERQALALMDHPNVAKVLDAGTTESGRPYFVMELVKGVSITEFCDQQKLATEGRLALFADVCRAIQHAHQKGIIHRDLKPSNVMVTMHDDKPVVKVIDFGVAKALSTKLTENTVYTSYGQMVGTPLYMSPEQAQLSGLDIDTRSDVYSLGVLLYELLTGTTPFDKETLNQAGYDEIRRIIREDEPPRPSIRISSLRADALSNVSDRRKIDPRKLGDSLRGELDWIVMKALEKDRNRRYESASALAADVGRLLSDEPVLACPPSWKYRTGKFLSKHRVATATSAVVALSLILGGLIAVGGWAGEANARQLAERERRNAEEAAEQEKVAKENEQAARQAADDDARRARETLDLILAVLSKAGSNRRTGATYTVRAALDDLVKELPKKENIDAHSVIEIKHALAIAHVAAGKFSDSITLLQDVEMATENDPDMKAECLRYLGYLQSDPEKLEQANLLEQRIGNSQRQSRTLALLGMYQLESGDLDKAVETLSRARVLFKPTGQLPMLAELPHVGYAIALSRKHDSGAEAAREEAERLALSVIGVGTVRWLDESHLWVSAGREDLGDFVLQAVLTHSKGKLTEANPVRDLGNRYASEGKYDRGDNLFTESHKMLDSSGQYKEAVWRLIFQARRRCEFGNYATAEDKYREAIEYHKRKPFNDPWTDLFIKNEFADVLWHVGREAEAKELYSEVAENLAASLRDDVHHWGGIGDIYVYMNSAYRVFPDQIPEDMKERYDRVFESDEFKDLREAGQQYWLSQRAYWAGDLEGAVKHWLEAKALFGFSHSQDFYVSELSQSLLREGRSSDAVEVLERLVELREKHLATHHPSRAICRILLAKTLLDAEHNPSQAKSMLEEARRVLEPHELGSPETLKHIDTLLSGVANEKNE